MESLLKILDILKYKKIKDISNHETSIFCVKPLEIFLG